MQADTDTCNDNPRQHGSNALWIEPTRHSSLELLVDDPLISAILRARGLTTAADAERFLNPLRGSLADPALLPDAERAVSRMRDAIQRGERILVYGDYDVDGLTSTAMLVRVLCRLGATPSTMIPHRLRDGYGLTMPMAEKIVDQQPNLVICVDCGSSSPDELQMLLDNGIDAIVADHHHYSGALPESVAFVSPQRPDNAYPFRDLAAVGVTYMLVRLLLGDDDAEMYLPYVALGSVADVVELRGENRVLVAKGISKMRRWQLPGLRAMCASAGLDQSRLSTWHIGFVIGPRINAAGRVADPDIALDLLLADDATTATPLALQLNDLNEHRRAETTRVLEEAEGQLREIGWQPDFPAIVVAGDGWSNGIVGLVASRLVDRFYRPAIVLEHRDGVVRGSARSVPGVDIVQAISASSDILDRFGGHEAAAGLSMQAEMFDAFVHELNASVLDLCGGRLPQRTIAIDAEADPSDLDLGTVDALEQLEPFGQGNPEPHLLIRGLSHRYAKTSRDGRHLLLQVGAEGRRGHRAVLFGAGHRLPELLRLTHIDIVTRLQRDTWDGRTSLKLYLVDFRPSTVLNSTHNLDTPPL
ncbi:MAG: single-stranded-DNA-specific exonuclease RecJ [Thermomicrobiales bacterium]|nr:single-stranded-DNA-specific exonuclease RecJ [Thermomicrobiales bacterium]